MIRKLKLSVENVRKLLLDDHADRLQKNTHMIKRKEEATIAAKEEIKAQTLREMQLQSEVELVNNVLIFLAKIYICKVERVLTALPETQNKLTAASEKADAVLSEVKKMEIRYSIIIKQISVKIDNKYYMFQSNVDRSDH